MRFEVSPQSQEAEGISENKSFYLGGLTPVMTVDMSEKCAAGVAAIREETTLGNGATALFTLGIWTPRRTTYFCIEEN